MADMSHLEKMGRELKCPICWSLLNSAVSLSCNHVFCNSCIVRSMKSDSTCPVCKVPFRRREVRAAPQMDNLVSIYKRMEIASGINIFVSQTAPSKNSSGEEKQADKQSNCDRREIGTTFQEAVVNTSNGRAKLNTDLKTTKTEKPSFPTKKRVQVAHYPLPETPVQPPKLDSRFSGPNDMDNPLTTRSVPNEGGEIRLSPFFWLKDDNNEEAELSHESDGDHSMDTPPNIPTFSDIQDSDNETPSEIADPLTTRSVPNEGGEIRLSPFFWLKDDNNEEAELSHESDGDHSMDTPPNIPTFSDIQDSDNETPSEIADPLTTRSVPNEGGEIRLSPFFWLKDDNNEEAELSHESDGDHSMDTPPNIPTFSDIQDSDNETTSEIADPLTTRSVPNEGGEIRLSPFFWLKDDNNEEAELSHESDGDHSMDTPPNIPTFSDIQDSDNETPSEIAQGKRNSRPRFEDNFYSEMFEWTQRPCSPELCSTPAKIQVSDAEEIIKVQGEEKVSASRLRSSCAISDSDETEYFSCEQGTSVRGSQQNCSQKNDVDVRSQAEITKNGRKGKKGTGQKELKANRYLSDGAFVDVKVSELDCANTHKDDTPKSEKKSTKRSYKRKSFCKSSAKVPFRLNHENGSREIGCPDTTRTVNEISESGTRKTLNEIKSQMQVDIVNPSNAKRNAPTENTTPEEVTADGTSAKVDNVCQVFTTSGKDFSELGIPTQKGRQRRSVTTEMGRALRSTKKLKVSFNEICKERSHASSVSMIPGKKIQNVQDILGKPGRSANGSSLVEGKSLLTAAEVVLRKCNSAPEKAHCAFCHSAEESEAYGEMVHYLNGKPIAADHSGGSDVIHSHRNCTEWAPNVYFQDDIAINLTAEIVRSRKIKCGWCGIRGAALGCYKKGCRKSFHVPCATSKPEFRWDTENFVILCPFHASSRLPCEASGPERRSKSNSKAKRQDDDKAGKVAGNVDSAKTLNRLSLETCNKIVLCCSALSITEKEIVSEFEKLSGVRECKKWSSNVTHVIASTDENGACRRTLKFLMAILEGKWILSVDWIKACINSKGLVDEQQYEIRVDIHGVQDGPRLGRLRRINQEPKLFHGLRFYLCGDFAPSYKGYLHELITAAGGIMLHRKPVLGEHNVALGTSTPSTFVIYSLELPEKCNLSKKDVILNQRRAEAESLAVSTQTTAASNSWVLNSIAASALQNI